MSNRKPLEGKFEPKSFEEEILSRVERKRIF